MDLEFTPRSCGPDGWFAQVHAPDGAPLFVVSTHAYQQPDGSWAPKTPPGAYACVRGIHCLEHGEPFETFEVTNVPGHTAILIHKGNLPQVDSAGCFLAGLQIGVLSGKPAVLQSGVAFDKFMALQAGVDTFTLTVCNT